MGFVKSWSLYIVIIFSVYSCKNSTDNKREIRQDGIAEESLSDEYKRKALKNDSVFDRRLDSLLKHLNEPDLKSRAVEAFRFIFYEYPKEEHVLFRIEKDSNNKVTFVTKYYTEKDERSGEGEDKVTKEIVKVLTLTDWKEIQIEALESYLWSLEMRDSYENGPCRGAFWTIEGRRIMDAAERNFDLFRFREYARVYRISPYKGSFFDLGLAIAQLHDVSLEKTLSKYFQGRRVYLKYK